MIGCLVLEFGGLFFFLLFFFVFQPGFVAFVASVAFVGGFCGFTMLYLSS